MLGQLQLRRSGHLVRMGDEQLPKRLFYGGVATGCRRQGGQIRRYKDTPKISLKRPQIDPAYQDRPTWRRAGKTGAAIYEVNRITATKVQRGASDDTVEPTTSDETGLLRLMSRFSQQTHPPEETSTVSPQKPIEFPIIEKVTDEKTGAVKLVLDTVTYQPSAANAAVTSMNRRQWRMHRRKLREILRSKRLKSYEERMKNYQPPSADQEAEQVNPDEDDEWSAGDEDDVSSSSDSSDEDTDDEAEEDDGEEEEEDSDSVHGASKTKRNHHPLIDDEAEEEDGDEEGSDGDTDEDDDTKSVNSKFDAKTPSKEVSALSYASPQLEEPDDFTDLPNEAQPVHHFNVPVAGSTASRFIPQRKCAEPGDIDLFASESTILPDKTFNLSRALSSTRFEADPAQDSSMTIRSERSSWNDTPGSLLFSQKQPSTCSVDTVTSTTKVMSEPDDGDGTIATDTQETLLLSTQTQVPIDSTLQITEDTQKLDEGELAKLENDNPAKPILMRAYKATDHQPPENVATSEAPTPVPTLVNMASDTPSSDPGDAPAFLAEAVSAHNPSDLIQADPCTESVHGSSLPSRPTDVSHKEDEIRVLHNPSPSTPPRDSVKIQDMDSVSTVERRRRLRINGDEDEDDSTASKENVVTGPKKSRPPSPPSFDKKLLPPSIKKEALETKTNEKLPLTSALDFLSTFKQNENLDESDGDEEVADEGTDDELEEGAKESDYSTSDVGEEDIEAPELSGSDLEEAYLIGKASRPEGKRPTKNYFSKMGTFLTKKERSVNVASVGEGLNADPLSNNPVDMDETDEEDDEADDAASRWLSGGAGVMSRWLLQGAAQAGASEATDVQPIRPDENKPTAGQETSPLASPPDRLGNLASPAFHPALKKCSSASCVSSPPSLQRIRRGSFLLRSTSLFTSTTAGTVGQPSPQSVLSRTEVDTTEVVNEHLLLLREENRSKPDSCVLGLQSKVGLSCFSVNPAGDDVAPPTARFSVHPSSQPVPATATVFSQGIRKRISAESVQNSVKKSRVSSIFNALL
nr:unnamed protein product [Spirometra erinaceieuropaei]